MEDRIPAFAAWLGANVPAFFLLATIAGFSVVLAFWYLIIRQRESLARWSWPVAWLTAYAALAFVATIIGIVLFVELADEIEAGEDIAAFDRAFTDSLRASTARSTLSFFSYVTHLGDPVFLFVVSATVTLVLLWNRKRLLAAAWIVVTAGNGLLTRTLKAIFERTRPLHDHGLLSLEGWSFPSGHASASLAVYGMLAYVVLRGRDLQWWHLPLLFAATALTMVVGCSRAMLQVHYLSDVLAGYLVAGSWVCLCIAGLELARTRAPRSAAGR